MRKVYITLVISLLVAVSCGQKRNAIGDPDTVIVVADSADWLLVQEDVRGVFSEVIRTPQREEWYSIMRVPPARFTEFMDYKNILLLSLLREDSRSLGFIEQALADDIVESMKSGEVNVAKKDNPWRALQLLVIATAPNAEQFAQVMDQRGEEIRGYFDEMFDQRQMKYLYGRYEQERMSRRLQEDYLWSFRIPRDWVIIHERPEQNFFWIGRHLPIRWVSVYWENTDGPVPVDSTTAVRLRRTVASEQYGDVSSNAEFFQTEEITIDGQPAIRLRGLWSHDSEAKGGPFTGVTYYDPETQRLFYIDGQLFAPDLEKLVYLRQMEVISSTFHSGPPQEG